MSAIDIKLVFNSLFVIPQESELVYLQHIEIPTE